MITLPLTIRNAGQPLREPVAWLLPGAEPASWIEELVHWRVPLQQLTLYPLPKSEFDHAAGGVLVVSSKGPASAGAAPDTSHRRSFAVPYGVVTNRIYLPVDAVLQPQADDRELLSLLASEIDVYVFHPTAGLIGFTRDQARRVSDLLQLPPRSETTWSHARPGVAFNQRLLSIALADPPSVREILEAGKGDIGSEAASIPQLPPLHDEPSNMPAAQAGRGAMAGIAKAVMWLTNLAPNTASAPTWINTVQNWAASKLSSVAQAVDAIRNKEIRRLLDLLENNPDEGLRYAMPLDGAGHRGIAPPSNYLGQHSTDFSLSRLGGGWAGDPWCLDWEYHQRLRELYRELANREIRLGRHRRAAYIFAELLNDLNSAAQTLMDGGYYREAAVICRDKLNRPREAAECLEQGGLFAEAIALYEELGSHEQVGDLYTRLDQRDEAQAAYRKAADGYIASGDILSASRICDEKMGLADEAISLLEAAWPHSPQARRCLEKLFKLVGRLGRHAEARRHIETFREADFPAPQTTLLASILADTATNYPDDAVRATAADSCRVVTGRRLAQAPQHEQRELLNAVQSLAREDRLLRRDCDRFGRKTTTKSPSPKPLRTPGLAASVRPLATFQLPEGVQWVNVVPAGPIWFAAGYRNDELILIRGNWKGQIQQPTGKPWRVPPSMALLGTPVPLAPRPDGVGAVWVGCPTLGAVSPRVFVPTNSIDFRSEMVMPPHEVSFIGAMVRTASGVGHLVTLPLETGSVVYCYDGDGRIVSTKDVTFTPRDTWMVDTLPIKVHALHGAIYVATGGHLVQLGRVSDTYDLDFQQPINSLTGTAPHTLPRLALTFPEGGVVVWPQPFDLDKQQRFAIDLRHPVACFTRAGSLVATSRPVCEVYDTNDEQVELIASLRIPDRTPLTVMPAGQPNDFAVMTEDGEMQVYRIE